MTGASAGPTAAVTLFSAALVLGGCGLTGPAHGPPSPNAATAVTMGFESYSPATVTVRSGDTVEWQNTSLITHTVTDNPKLAEKAGDASLPPGATAFDSGDIAAGQVYLPIFVVSPCPVPTAISAGIMRQTVCWEPLSLRLLRSRRTAFRGPLTLEATKTPSGSDASGTARHN